MDAISLFENAWQDVVFATRTFRFNKGFFAVATLSLALGIGANTAIFQLLDALRLRALPVSHAEQLVQLHITKNEHCCSGNFSNRHPDFTYAQWEQIRDHQRAFLGVFAFGDDRFNLAAAGEPRLAQGLWVSGGFFKTLGVPALLGRLIEPQDDRRGCGSANAVISYAFWQREFGGSPAVIGKPLRLSGHMLSISGITPANFYGVEVGKNFDVALPLCAEPLLDGEDSHLTQRHHWWLAVIGRLKPEWNTARASAQVKTISTTVFGETVPSIYRPDQAEYYTKYELEAQPAGSGVSSLRESYQEPLLLLLGIAGLVLLIACSNLANLMLARASAREREMAIRLAIGANRGRLVRQLLMESLALTVTGSVVGGFLAQFLSEYLVSFLSTGGDPVFMELALDWRVVGFMAGLSILTCLLFGLTPALRATQTDPASTMKASGRGVTADRQKFGLRRVLVVSQVALSLVLLVAALLFVRSLRNLLTLDAGFEQNGILVVKIDASTLPLSTRALQALFEQLLEDMRHSPGVEQAASARIVPLSGDFSNDSIEIVGERNDKRMHPWFDRVSDGYFRTMGIPIVAGRDFDTRDTPSSPEAALVNEKFCQKFLANTNPLGKEIRILTGPGEPPHTYEIVGLVKDTKYGRLKDDFEPIVFTAERQDKTPERGINLLVRSNTSLGSLLPALKKALLRRNGGLSFEFQSMQAQVADSLVRERMMAALSAFFGFLAVLLAMVGLYGVISYMVARRRNEIGIRIALGASRQGIIKLVMTEAVALLAAGLVIGAVLSTGAAGLAHSLLYGLKPTDPGTLTAAIAGLAAVAALASIFPALRAARVEPMSALREE